MRNDLVFAVRTLIRQRTLTLSAVLTLALGIGATIALFSAVDAALLRPLPFPHPEDLYTLRTAITTGRPTSGLVAPVELTPLNGTNGPIVSAVGSQTNETVLDDPTHPLQIKITGVTEGFFEMFGLPMIIGRGFVPAEHQQGAPVVVVLSSHLWRTAFGSNPAIAGTTVRFSRGPMTVVGVAPPEFDTIGDADAWMTVRVNPLSHVFDGYMRVRPGVPAERVRQELSAIAARLAREYPVFNTDRVYVARPLVDSIVGDLKPTLIVAFSAAALLLMLACVNVIHLLLARAAVRTREIAVRAALGAGRLRIIRQLVIESLVLVGLGAALGVLVARIGVRLLLAVGGSNLPRLGQAPFSLRVFLFALGVTAIAGLLVGLAPALRLLSVDLKSLMSDGGRTATGSARAHRTLSGMIVAEITLALALVTGAGWLVRDFRDLESTVPGFSADRRLVFNILVPRNRYRQGERVAVWTDTVLDGIRQIPGVVAAGSASSLPLGAERDQTVNVGIAGRPQEKYPPAARWRSVTPGWFEAMGIRIEAGRSFTRDDRLGSPPVIIVNRAFAERYLKGSDPTTMRLVISNAVNQPWIEVPIVGVADDVKYVSFSQPAEPTLYTAQDPMWRQTIVVTTSLDNPAQLVPAIESEVHELDSSVPVDADLLPRIVASSLSRRRLGMLVMTWFGAAALALAAIGIYGVVAYAVSQRLGEMCIRKALGATRRDIFWLVMNRGRAPAALGIVAGVVAAMSLGRMLRSQLVAARATDAWVLGAAVAIVAGIAAVAMLIPALRASSVDPGRVLRLE